MQSPKCLPPPPSAEEGGEPVPLSHLWIFRRMDINLVSTTNAGMAVHLGNFLEPKYQDGSPLSKLPMTVPISVGTRVRRLRGISEATYARTVTEPLGTATGLWDLQHQLEQFGLGRSFGFGLVFCRSLFSFIFVFSRLRVPPLPIIFRCSQGEIGDDCCGSIPKLFAKRYGLRRSYQIFSNLTDCSDLLRPLTGIAWLSKVPSPHSQSLGRSPCSCSSFC